MKKEQTGFDGTTDSDTTRREGSGEQTDEHATGVGNRRQFLIGVGAATAFLAGCVGGDDGDGSDNGDDSTGNGGDDGSTGNGGDDSSTGNGGDNTGNGGDDSTGNGGDDSTGSGSDDSSGGDDGSGDDSSGGDDGSGDDSSGGDDGSGDDSSGGDDGSGTTSEEFFNTVNWSPEFRAVFTDEDTTGEYRVNDGEQYFSTEGGEAGGGEFYILEDAAYVVREGECTVFDDQGSFFPDAPTDFEDTDDLEAQQPDVTKIGTDTVDGDPVTVYEVDGETTYTMYVLESGFLRRIETPQGGANYYDWGDTEPIEPPDMECTSPGGGDDGGGYP